LRMLFVQLRIAPKTPKPQRFKLIINDIYQLTSVSNSDGSSLLRKTATNLRRQHGQPGSRDTDALRLSVKIRRANVRRRVDKRVKRNRCSHLGGKASSV